MAVVVNFGVVLVAAVVVVVIIIIRIMYAMKLGLLLTVETYTIH